MLYMKTHTVKTITVPNLRTLRAAWRTYRSSDAQLWFIVSKPLSDAQLRKLPEGLRERLTVSAIQGVK